MTKSDLQKAILALDRATMTSELVQATQTLCGLRNLEAAPTLIKVLGFNNAAVGAVATHGLFALGRVVVPSRWVWGEGGHVKRGLSVVELSLIHI